MQNIIAERIKNVSLTKGQQKIADYFMRNPERVGMSSSMDVAKEIGVSDVSITRFARAIGYAGFTELKNDLYSRMASQATGGINSLSMSDRLDFNRAAFQGQVSGEQFLRISRYNEDRTFQQNGDERFFMAADMLMYARHRYVVGFRGCRSVAVQCEWLMRFVLDHVIAVTDEAGGGVGQLQDAGPEDCVLFFSVARYYKSDVRLAELIRRRGSRLCVVTDSVISPLAEMADVLILAEIRHMSFFNSMTPLHLVAEYLVTLIEQRRTDQYREKSTERDELTEELRIP